MGENGEETVVTPQTESTNDGDQSGAPAEESQTEGEGENAAPQQ